MCKGLSIESELLSEMASQDDDHIAFPGNIPGSPTNGHSRAGIVMVSPPASQDDGNDCIAPQDEFHTPPEVSSLHSSDNDVQHCSSVNHAVNVDAGTPQSFVPLSDASKLVDLGTKSTDLGEQIGNIAEKLAHRVRVEENPNQSSSGTRVLPPSIHAPIENGGTKLGSGGKKKKVPVFKKAFLENTRRGGEAENDLDDDGLGLLRVAKQCGITFPRPRWWPDGEDDDFDKLKICERKKL